MYKKIPQHSALSENPQQKTHTLLIYKHIVASKLYTSHRTFLTYLYYIIIIKYYILYKYEQYLFAVRAISILISLLINSNDTLNII